MTLTKEMSDVLKGYFPVQAHEFIRGFTFIAEEWVSNRLDEVDPSWSFERIGDFIYRDKQVIATFRLTVGGTSRDGVGMDTVKENAGEAEKSAATDALKRCGRLFGIGRYILEMHGVTNEKTLTDWLTKRRGVNKETGEIAIVDKTPQPVAEKTATERLMGNGHTDDRRIGNAPQKGAVVSNNGNWEYDRIKMFMEVGKVALEVPTPERNNTVIKLEGEGAFKSIESYEQGVKIVIDRLNSPEHGKSKKEAVS